MNSNEIKDLKNNYIQGNFKILQKLNNGLIGSYNLIYLTTCYEIQYFYMKTMKLKEFSFDDYLFNKKINTNNKNINKFYFSVVDKSNKNYYDFIFEYNPTLFELLISKNKNIFKGEKEIWLLIEDILEAYNYFEGNNDFLKQINLHSITLKDNKYFSLLNPFLFENYFNEYLKMYLNKKLDLKLTIKNKINKNLIEFGIIIWNILNKDYDNINLINYKVYLDNIKNNISQKLYDLLIWIFNNDYKFIFSEIRLFLMKGSSKGDIFEKILLNYKNINSPYQNINKIKELNFDKEYYSGKLNKIKKINNKYNNNLEYINKNTLPKSMLYKFNSFENNKIDNNKKNIFKIKSEENNGIFLRKKSEQIVRAKSNFNKKNIPKFKSLKHIDYNYLFDNKIEKENLNKSNTEDKHFLVKKSPSKLKNKNSIQNKIVTINLINDKGNFSKLYKLEDYYDSSKNSNLYKKIDNVINWNSNLKESLYHKNNKKF